jgi:hypothetical protein
MAAARPEASSGGAIEERSFANRVERVDGRVEPFPILGTELGMLSVPVEAHRTLIGWRFVIVGTANCDGSQIGCRPDRLFGSLDRRLRKRIGGPVQYAVDVVGASAHHRYARVADPPIST